MPTTLTPAFRVCADRSLRAALGKPWRALGRGPGAFDCWGLVLWVYGAAGLVAGDFDPEVGNRTETLSEARQSAGNGLWERIARPEPYCLVLLGRGGVTSHVAIYHPTGIFYHAIEGHGVVAHPERWIRGLFSTVEFWRLK